MPFAAIFTICAALSQTPTESMEVDAARRLSAAWSRAAVGMLAEPGTPGSESFPAAIEVALAAAELTPDSAQAWRIVFDLSQVGDAEQPAVCEARRKALKELNRLDPKDEVVRLARLNDAIERSPTADERLKAYDKALAPASRQTLGAPVSARLALDLALLEQRRGSTAGWQKWLREAVAIDPSFPLAAETLAGVEAGSEASLKVVAASLVRAVIANPGSTVSLSALSRICLHEGLYAEADRLLAVAVRAADLNINMLIVDELLADRMLALWGLGKHDEAINAYLARRRQVNTALRRRLGDTTATETDADRAAGPQVHLPESVNSVWSAMLASKIMSPTGAIDIARDAESKQLKEALAFTLEGLTQEATEAKSDSVKAVIDLRKAWLEATIGDPASVEGLLESAQRVSPMSDEAVARFQGWVSLRRGRFDEALAKLQPIAAKDSGARVGAAMAMAGLGRKRDAATELLAVFKENRDNAVGLFAMDRLEGLVQKRPGPSAEAQSVREAVSTIPEPIFALVGTQGQALNVQVAFGPPTNPFEPLPLRVTIQNRTTLPLEITPSGPIESKAALLLEAVIVGDRKNRSLPPSIIPIDRRLLLKPRESVEFELDMSRTKLGNTLLAAPLSGIFVKARLVTNFHLTADRVAAGFMGNQSDEATLRLPATQVDAGWREDALGEIREPDRAEDMVKLVQFAYDLARTPKPDEKDANREAEEKRIADGWAAVNEAWKKLPPVGKAWALMVLPNGEDQMLKLAPTLEVAKVATDERVRMSYLLRWVQSPDDTQLAAAARLGGRLAIAANGVKSMLQAIARDNADPNQGLEDVGVLGGGSGGASGAR